MRDMMVGPIFGSRLAHTLGRIMSPIWSLPQFFRTLIPNLAKIPRSGQLLALFYVGKIGRKRGGEEKIKGLERVGKNQGAGKKRCWLGGVQGGDAAGKVTGSPPTSENPWGEPA